MSAWICCDMESHSLVQGQELWLGKNYCATPCRIHSCVVFKPHYEKNAQVSLDLSKECTLLEKITRFIMTLLHVKNKTYMKYIFNQYTFLKQFYLQSFKRRNHFRFSCTSRSGSFPNFWTGEPHHLKPSILFSLSLSDTFRPHLGISTITIIQLLPTNHLH